MEKEKISIIILTIVGIVVSVDIFLEIFFSIGVKQNILAIGYFCSFLLLSEHFKNINKNKFVMIPFYMAVVLQLMLFILKFV